MIVGTLTSCWGSRLPCPTILQHLPGVLTQLVPTGIVLRRVGYYTIPSMEELGRMVNEDGQCLVENFTVGRKGTDWSKKALVISRYGVFFVERVQ